MDEFPWKYVIFYVFYYDNRKYTGNFCLSRSVPLNSHKEFTKMEAYVKDAQKKEYFYGIGLVVTGVALLAKPSIWERIKLYFHN